MGETDSILVMKCHFIYFWYYDIGILFTFNYCTVCLVKIWFVYYLSIPTQKEAFVRKMKPFSLFLPAFSAYLTTR